MTDWPTLNVRANDANLRAFGEPVILPGDVPVVGVFDPLGDPATALGPEAGLVTRAGGTPNPVVYLQVADAVGLAQRNRLTIRGQQYLVARIDDQGDGLVEQDREEIANAEMEHDQRPGRGPGAR